jgi:hypothetical protein
MIVMSVLGHLTCSILYIMLCTLSDISVTWFWTVFEWSEWSLNCLCCNAVVLQTGGARASQWCVVLCCLVVPRLLFKGCVWCVHIILSSPVLCVVSMCDVGAVPFCGQFEMSRCNYIHDPVSSR